MVIYLTADAILCLDLLLEVVRRQLLEMIVHYLDLVELTQELALESTQQNPLKFLDLVELTQELALESTQQNPLNFLVELELFQQNQIPESPEVNLIFL